MALSSLKRNCFIGTVFLLSSMPPLLATQYNVGDAAGWGLTGMDYGAWASRNSYQVGDSLYFAYAAGTHSVLQVNQQDFQNCVTTNPISSDNSVGNKMVYLSNPGTYYFICGFPGHCAQGMRFSITVNGGGGSASPYYNAPGNYPYYNTPGIIFNQGVSWRNSKKGAFLMGGAMMGIYLGM